MGLALALTTGCDPEYVVGIWSCPDVTNSSDAVTDGGTDAGMGGGIDGAASDSGMTSDGESPLPFPWYSGFEDGFCGYFVGGFCYSDPGASYTIVTSPVHSGRFAAAFTVDSSMSNAHQTRCVRQGVLPAAAYYGAWYFVPSLQANSGVWNLFHFQGGSSPGADRLHGLLDLSLINDSSGNLKVTFFDFLQSLDIPIDSAPPIPIGSWFHLEIYVKRAADATGEVIVYLNGDELYHFTDIITDDSSWGQWYVGNFATALMPAGSTIYVDDVEISETR